MCEEFEMLHSLLTVITPWLDIISNTLLSNANFEIEAYFFFLQMDY